MDPTQNPSPESPPQPSEPAVSPSSTPSEPTSTPDVASTTDSIPDSFGQVTVSPAGAEPAPTTVGKKQRSKKKPLIFGLLALLVIGGAAAFYFGYYANPKVIYGQSLKNTGLGYDKLVDYVDAQDSHKYKGYVGTGSYKFTQAGGATSDGKIALHGDGDNADLTFDVGLAATRVSVEARTIKSSGDIPDIYVKASGIKGLGALIGAPTLDAQLATLDDQWIVIDHTLIETLDNQVNSAAGTANSTKPPTKAQILDEMRAFGKVNQDYVFSTSSDKGLTKIVKVDGKETINGHKTVHYTVVIQKDNLKKYITAQRDALKASKLYAWVKDNKYDSMVNSYYDELEGSAGDLTTKDSTFDIWVDASKHIVYKVRIDGSDNPAKEFVDVGLDYKGGDDYPFFIDGLSKDGGSTDTFNFTTTLNTKAQSLGFKVAFTTDGANAESLTANFTYKPTDVVTPVVKPANAKQLADVLNQLGYGSLLTELQNPGAATDTAFPDDTLFQ